MKNNLKENKGITLVALIITIIVLLILAVVTISAVNEGSLFAHANNAATEYSEAADKENTMISNYLSELAKHDRASATPEEPSAPEDPQTPASPSTPQVNSYGFYEDVVYTDGTTFYHLIENIVETEQKTTGTISTKIIWNNELANPPASTNFKIKNNPIYKIRGTDTLFEGLFFVTDDTAETPIAKITSDNKVVTYAYLYIDDTSGYDYITAGNYQAAPNLELNWSEIGA